MEQFPRRNSFRRRRSRSFGFPVFMGIVVFVLAFVVGLVFYIRHYAPTDEHMALSEFYELDDEDGAVVIVNGEYVTMDGVNELGLVSGGATYIEIGAIKKWIDNGYVFDNVEGILRYATDSEVVSAKVDETGFTVGRETRTLSVPIVIKAHEKVFLATEFVQQFSDMQCRSYTEPPARIIVEKAGYERTLGTLKSHATIRRLGGPKSKVLKDGSRGEEVVILNTVGKWSNVLTEDGVIGYVKSSRIKNKRQDTVKATLPERNYTHSLMGKRVVLGWHQMMNQDANASVSSVLDEVGNLNVISPTWFYLNDNVGGIENHASSSYVKEAHARGIKVWGLVSNFEDSSVDTTVVLNTTSARDNLVNNLVGAAIAVGMDGINVDFELLPEGAADGYAAFIRELSLKCKKNELVLSVDVNIPTSWNGYYDRKNLANYCDYVIIMGYDEHYSGGKEAGSTGSLPWVREGVKATLEEVPAQQVILGMPFYSRVWSQKDGELSSSAIHMKDIPDYLERHGLKQQWLDGEEQNYAEYTEDDVRKMLWIEDATSMGERLVVMQENGLGGCAFWKLGNEPESIWEVIDAYGEE